MTTAVDIGGTYITAATVRDKKIIKRINIPTEAEKGQDQVLKNIKDAISQVLDGPIGIGCPGPLDPKTGVIISPPNLPFDNFNLKEALEEFNVPVQIDNDANCFALGEASRLNSEVVVGITLGTGVGGGIIIGNHIFHGNASAGEFWNMIGIENQRHIESYLGRYPIKDSYGKEPEKLYEDCMNDDPKALEFAVNYGTKLGSLLANIVSFIDPHIIVIGGGISKANRFFHDSSIKILTEKVSWFTGEVIYSEDTVGSALLGAADLFRKDTLIVKKPWGNFKRFTHDEISTVKIITVEQGGILSLQTHKLRDEIWVMLDDGLTVELDGKKIRTKTGDEIFIRKGMKHRISAEKDARFLEISFGHFDEEDIIRYEDSYDRI